MTLLCRGDRAGRCVAAGLRLEPRQKKEAPAIAGHTAAALLRRRLPKTDTVTVVSPKPQYNWIPSNSIVDIIDGAPEPTHTACIAEMGAACVASAGANPFTGTAASMTVFPIIPDFERYPEYGRDLDRTFGEIGLAGHWIKILLHHMFLYKAQLRPGWHLIPE